MFKAMTMLCNQQLFAVTHCLLVWFIVVRNAAGLPAGMEIKKSRICGPHNETAKLTVYPWPLVPAGKPANISIMLTPVVDVLAATIQYEFQSESDGRVILRDRVNVCPYAPQFCSLAARETSVWTASGVMTEIPSSLKMLGSVRFVANVFNEDDVMFFCLDALLRFTSGGRDEKVQ